MENTFEASAKKLMLDIDPIHRTASLLINRKEDMATIVETPLVSACEILYDKNIETRSSSANKVDIAEGRPAHIAINYETLSDRNKEIAQTIGEIKDGILWLSIPLNTETTVEDIEEKANNLVSKFEIQRKLWPKPLTLNGVYVAQTGMTIAEPKTEEAVVEELKKQAKEFGFYFDESSGALYMSEADMQKGTPPIVTARQELNKKTEITEEERTSLIKSWEEKGGYYDKESGLFYANKTDFEKATIDLDREA